MWIKSFINTLHQNVYHVYTFHIREDKSNHCKWHFIKTFKWAGSNGEKESKHPERLYFSLVALRFFFKYYIVEILGDWWSFEDWLGNLSNFCIQNISVQLKGWMKCKYFISFNNNFNVTYISKWVFSDQATVKYNFEGNVKQTRSKTVNTCRWQSIVFCFIFLLKLNYSHLLLCVNIF